MRAAFWAWEKIPRRGGKNPPGGEKRGARTRIWGPIGGEGGRSRRGAPIWELADSPQRQGWGGRGKIPPRRNEIPPDGGRMGCGGRGFLRNPHAGRAEGPGLGRGIRWGGAKGAGAPEGEAEKTPIISDKSDEIRVLFNYINIYIILIYVEDEPVAAPLPAGLRFDPDRMEGQQEPGHGAEAAQEGAYGRRGEGFSGGHGPKPPRRRRRHRGQASSWHRGICPAWPGRPPSIWTTSP